MTSPAVFKHHVQVPWYNCSEWKFVYHEIFNEDSTVNRKQNAAKILNVWKVRMPRLFSGVDGTLIILSAILEDYKGFPDEIVRQVQASAVMRFLNICVVSQTKASQETLFQTARNKNLPDWLINLRHDFAHAQRIPSKDMLSRALVFSLNWLKTNYWDQQYPMIKDYMHNQPDSDKNLIEFVRFYGEMILYFQDQNDDVKQKFAKQLKRYNVGTQGSLFSILEQITKSQIDSRAINSCKLCDIIIADGAFFNLPESSEDLAIFIKAWLPMLRLLHYFNRLLLLLSMLIGICCTNTNSPKSHNAAVWIHAISELLIRQRSYIVKEEDGNFDKNFKKFALEVSCQTNPHMDIYLKTLLTAAKCKEDFINDVYQAVQAFNCTDATMTSDTIYTVESVREMVGEEIFNGLNPSTTIPGSKWKIVDDLYMFDGIPIGQSPEENYHPVLRYFKNG